MKKFMRVRHQLGLAFLVSVLGKGGGERIDCETPPAWQTVLPDTGMVVDLMSTDWKLRSGDGNYEIDQPKLPSDLLTNLMQAGLIQDPYLDRNFLTERHVWMGEHARDDNIHTNRTRTWIYSTTFELPSDVNAREHSWKLVVEGIKMGAHLEFNGVHLGTVTNQFLRYVYDVSNKHRIAQDPQNNLPKRQNLTVIFDPSITVDGRFAACSGGWDWAPYTKSEDAQGRRSYTLGIIRPIYLVAIKDVAIDYVVPKLHYKGEYAREPLEKTEGDFEMKLDVHLDLAEGDNVRSLPDILILTPFHRIKVPLVVSHSELISKNKVFSTNVKFSKEKIELWWPNNMGKQPLYDIHVGFDQPKTSMLKKQIAFRDIALVTINEGDEKAINDAIHGESEGSGSHGMFFRVNGALLVARGANFIPMDQLEGRLSDKAHRIAVRSAADANMNMLRIWGGGMILPPAFYQACDEFGILLYHDMIFVDEAGHRPLRDMEIEKEIRHTVRSLASHPSIAVWNGCNECQVVMGTPSEIYATFVMELVAEEDDTRSIWPSSPSKHGWKTGVYTLNSRPNGRPLSTWDPDSFNQDLESHGPYMRSFSRDFPGVNGIDVGFPYKNTPPSLPRVPVGVSVPNIFSSEFGATVWSSSESMEGSLSSWFWSLHGNGPPDSCTHVTGNENACFGSNVMAERNYPCDTHILAYFGTVTSLDAVGESALQEQMYHCLMAQMLWMKGEIEKRRSSNFYGLLIWQFNENWPTGGWGCVEYGPQDKPTNQVTGGRWKPLMYLLKSVLFQDVAVACGREADCYVRNDKPRAVSIQVSLEGWQIGKQVAMKTLRYSSVIASDCIYRWSLPQNFIEQSDAVLINVETNQLHAKKSQQNIETIFLPSHPKDMPRLRKQVSIDVHSIAVVNNSMIKITLQSDSLALFVVMTTRAQGRFSENAFALRPVEPKTIYFTPMLPGERLDLDQLQKTLRIEHLGYYLSEKQDHHVSLS